jgi:hypothetical protein
LLSSFLFWSFSDLKGYVMLYEDPNVPVPPVGLKELLSKELQKKYQLDISELPRIPADPSQTSESLIPLQEMKDTMVAMNQSLIAHTVGVRWPEVTEEQRERINKALYRHAPQLYQHFGRRTKGSWHNILAKFNELCDELHYAENDNFDAAVSETLSRPSSRWREHGISMIYADWMQFDQRGVMLRSEEDGSEEEAPFDYDTVTDGLKLMWLLFDAWPSFEEKLGEIIAKMKRGEALEDEDSSDEEDDDGADDANQHKDKQEDREMGEGGEMEEGEEQEEGEEEEKEEEEGEAMDESDDFWHLATAAIQTPAPAAAASSSAPAAAASSSSSSSSSPASPSDEEQRNVTKPLEPHHLTTKDGTTLQRAHTMTLLGAYMQGEGKVKAM